MSSRSSTDQPGTDPTAGELILVGRIRRPHGVHGAVVVESLSDNPQRFAAGSRLWTDAGGHLTVERAQEHRGALLVWFETVEDRDAAEALRGAELSVPESEVPAPEEGVWYQYQLVGCRCHDAAAGELGTVLEVLEDGGGLLLLVEDDAGRRLPVPFVAAFLRRVDVEARRIDLALPPGLIEACAS